MHRVLLLLLLFSSEAFSYGSITNTNRNQLGHGGWGPQLRSIFSDTNGDLWYVDDEQESDLRNARARYYKLGKQRWDLIATNEFYGSFGNIQQNTAHILRGSYIYSYGVDTQNHWLMECYFHTSYKINGEHYRGCNALFSTSGLIQLPNNSNYVGSAVTPSGDRVVWWTTTGTPGLFTYTYNRGAGWEDPISTPVTSSGNNYRFAGYLHMAFKDDTHVEFVGESSTDSTCTTNTCFALAGSFDLGGQATFTRLPALKSTDIWRNSEDGSYHALLYDNSGRTDYWYKASDTSNWAFSSSINGYGQARFGRDGNLLRLVLAGTQGTLFGIEIRSVSLANVNGAIDWNPTTNSSIDITYPMLSANEAMGAPTAIFIQEDSHQTTPVGFHFAITGRYPGWDNNTWYFGKEDSRIDN